VLAAALDSRFKAVVLLAGGFPRVELPAEIDLPNFAPRVHAPTLLIGGDNDFRSSPLSFRCFGRSACRQIKSATGSSTVATCPIKFTMSFAKSSTGSIDTLVS
jgi:pimeloyl-ACP methyl ester carboxylesterase